MKNITVSVDDPAYRAARIAAPERDTTVSALVRQFLSASAQDGGQGFERLAREERELRERVKSFRAADAVERDRLHER